MLSVLLVFIAGVFCGVVVELTIRLGDAYFNEGELLADLLGTTSFYYWVVFGFLGIIALGFAYWLHRKEIQRENERDEKLNNIKDSVDNLSSPLNEIKDSINSLVSEIRQERNERNNNK